MRRTDLPTQLRESPAFRVAEARRLGVTASRLRAHDLDTPYPGLRSTTAPTTLAERCLELSVRLHALQFFSHVTAAALTGMPLPWSAPDAPLHVGAIPPSREPRLTGVVGHRLRLDPAHLTLMAGVPVPTPAETWGQLGALACPFGCGYTHRHWGTELPTPAFHDTDLVAVADWILSAGVADREDLAEAISRVRRRGAVALTRALDLARTGVESPKESETRMILTSGGLPEPEINWVLRDRNGRFVARLDLAYPLYRVAVEYDGRQHASGEQFARDADRWAAISGEEWILIRVLSHHLDTPERRIVAPVRRALVSRGWRP